MQLDRAVSVAGLVAIFVLFWAMGGILRRTPESVGGLLRDGTVLADLCLGDVAVLFFDVVIIQIAALLRTSTLPGSNMFGARRSQVRRPSGTGSSDAEHSDL
jgi:hypothetical protein